MEIHPFIWVLIPGNQANELKTADFVKRFLKFILAMWWPRVILNVGHIDIYKFVEGDGDVINDAQLKGPAVFFLLKNRRKR